jgi:hypothetical protein
MGRSRTRGLVSAQTLAPDLVTDRWGGRRRTARGRLACLAVRSPGWAAALAAREALALRLHGIDQLGLVGRSSGESGIERAGMAEAAPGHLGDLCIVAGVERDETAAPAQRLGVVGVALLARCQNRPDRVEFAVLAQQVPVAQVSGFEIPDAHRRGLVALEGRRSRPPSSGGFSTGA